MEYIHDRNWGCRISDEYKFRDMRMLIIENELLRISVILDKGTDIYEFLYKPQDIDFMWRAPNPLRNPSAFVPAGSREDGFFQDFYHGGWQEIFPNGGTHCKYKNVELGQHGEVSIIPWACRIEKDSPEEVSAKMWVRTHRTPFYIEKTMTLRKNEAVLRIDEKIINEGEEEMEFMWGHHPAFGRPFLNSDCKIFCPAGKVEVQAPLFCEQSRLKPGAVYDSFPVIKDKDGNDYDLSLIPKPEVKTSEMCYLKDLEDGWYAIADTRRNVGFGMKWDRSVFPYVWLWEVFKGNYGFPWYGRTYNVALEPWTSYPGGMDNAMKKGTTKKMEAGESIETTLLAIAFEGTGQVNSIDNDGKIS